MEKRVFYAPCADYNQETVSAGVHDILEAFGGAAAIIEKHGKKVLLKPNLMMAAKPERAATTHPLVVSATAKEFISAGAKVVIADSPGGIYNPAYLKMTYHACGMDRAAEESGATLNYDCETIDTEYPEGLLCRRFPIIKPILDADIVISLGKMKTHGLAYISGTAKNMFGAIPGLSKPAFHAKYSNRAEFCRMLVDVCECVRPDFCIMDGIVGMEGPGPVGGTPKKAGILIGGINPYAVDLAAADFMRLTTEKSDLLAEAVARGFIPPQAEELSFIGGAHTRADTPFMPPIKTVRTRFIPKFLRPAVTALMVPYPFIKTDACTGCGNCALNCPKKIITIIEKKAVINYSDCIKCYCCHEFCAKKAIEFRHIIKKSRPNR